MNGNRALAAICCAALLGIATGAAPASAITKTYSSGKLHLWVSRAHPRLTTIRVPDRGHIKDLDVKVRVGSGEISNLHLYLFTPSGRGIALAEGGLSGSRLGSGPNSCKGTPTKFNDEATTPIEDGMPPYAGPFQPRRPLTVDRRSTKGRWMLGLVNFNALTAQVRLGCWKLRITS